MPFLQPQLNQAPLTNVAHGKCQTLSLFFPLTIIFSTARADMASPHPPPLCAPPGMGGSSRSCFERDGPCCEGAGSVFLGARRVSLQPQGPSPAVPVPRREPRALPAPAPRSHCSPLPSTDGSGVAFLGTSQRSLERASAENNCFGMAEARPAPSRRSHLHPADPAGLNARAAAPHLRQLQATNGFHAQPSCTSP